MALNEPDDSRQVVFTILPGHGLIVVEKWLSEKAPFQLLWELMDSGALRVVSRIPQGPLHYRLKRGRMQLVGSLLDV